MDDSFNSSFVLMTSQATWPAPMAPTWAGRGSLRHPAGHFAQPGQTVTGTYLVLTAEFALMLL